MASSKGATKGRTTNNRHRKGVLEMGISKGLPGTPERYRVMVGTEGVRRRQRQLLPVSFRFLVQAWEAPFGERAHRLHAPTCHRRTQYS